MACFNSQANLSRDVFEIEETSLIESYSKGDVDALSILVCKYQNSDLIKSQLLLNELVNYFGDSSYPKYITISKTISINQFCHWLDLLIAAEGSTKQNTNNLIIRIVTLDKELILKLINEIELATKYYKINQTKIKFEIISNFDNLSSQLPSKPLYTYTFKKIPTDAIKRKYQYETLKVFKNEGNGFEELNTNSKAILRSIINYNKSQ